MSNNNRKPRQEFPRSTFLRGAAALGVSSALTGFTVDTGGGRAAAAVAPRTGQTADSGTAGPVTLTGRDLSIDDLVGVANGKSVQLAPDAVKRVVDGHHLLLLAARKGHPIYGLNQGVGADKTVKIFQGDSVTPEARRISEQFNRQLLFVQASAVGPETVDDHVARAVMTARLNTMLFGSTGARVEIVEMLRNMLNHGIIPILPTRGSPGEADITIMPHLGLAMMGVGEVRVRGRRTTADQALKAAGLQPVRPFAKDALAIFSSNSYSAALAALLVHETRCVLDRADLVFALSLEGLDGNVAPFLFDVQQVRPYTHVQQTAGRILQLLSGSYLFRTSAKRALQDPLSYRDTSAVHGTARRLLNQLAEDLTVQLNSSDDNPAVIVGATGAHDASSGNQVQGYYVDDGALKGAVIPSANFDPLPWVVDVEALNISLSHVARSSVQRIIRLGSEKFTNISAKDVLGPQRVRFLVNNGQGIATPDGHTAAPLLAEVQTMANPVPAQGIALADGIEDVETFAPLTVRKGALIVDNLYRILGIELVNASNQVDLRRYRDHTIRFGSATWAAHDSFRKSVPFLADHQRFGSSAIESAYVYLKDGQRRFDGPALLL